MKRKVENFRNSLRFLETADFAQAATNLFYRSGVAAAFVRTFDRACKCLQALLPEASGFARELTAGTIRSAARAGILEDEGAWLEMLRARNHFLRAYDKEAAQDLLPAIRDVFLPALEALSRRIGDLHGGAD